MSNFDSLNINNAAFDAVRRIQETTAFATAMQMENSGIYTAIQEVQKTVNAMRVPFDGITAAFEDYQKLVAPISETLNTIHSIYTPIFEASKMFEVENMKGIFAGIQTSISVMNTVSKLNVTDFAAILDALPKYDFLSSIESEDFTVQEAEKLFEEGEITQQDVNEELVDIITKKKFSPLAKWDKLQKSKWLIAIQILFWIVKFVFSPVSDYVENKALDTLGITAFWEDSGLYECIDAFFDSFNKETVTEEEAKETVDTTKTGNISKQKREDLLAKIKEIRTFISSAPQDENTGNLLSYLSELEKDVNGKKYGLVFEEHREEIDEVLNTYTPVLTEEEDLFIDNGGQMNFLIEGDNLSSLKLLEKTHTGRIQMIYIDPPYNTGNKDFSYSDTKVDGLDGFRHSKWLSFMNSRLKIAKKLLATQGVIFISIDDNEMTTLKTLCDNIFGEQNFIANIIVKSNPRGSQSTKEIASVHEYVLVYAKDILSSAIIGHKLTDDMQSEYNLSDENGAYRLLGLRQRGGFWRASERPKLFYPFYVNPKNAHISLNEDDEHIISVYPYQPSTGEKGTWRWSREKVEVDFEKLIAKTVKRGNETVWDIYQKDYMSSGDTVRRTKAKSLWDEKEMNYQNAANELKELFGTSPFTYAKPTYLINRAMEMIDFNENSVILDFFAGSGTTGHAVMKLNAEDGGNRRFILCTNNENNICRDVTYERIRRVIGKEGYEASLKYYKVEYIPVSERMYYEYADELLRHIRELVELENGVNFTDNAEIAIVLTDEELEDFITNIEDFSKCKKLYMGHDLLPDEEQEQALSTHKIEVNIIPDYYYRDLQEC